MDTAQINFEMERQLVACVQDSLSMYLHSNANFMCERLCAEFPNSEVQSQPALHALTCQSWERMTMTCRQLILFTLLAFADDLLRMMKLSGFGQHASLTPFDCQG